MPHSTPSRTQRLLELADRQYDLAIIGGGITGAGMARDAARRGLKVALLERDDFASGTSSRSSRLAHGGVRYLEHGHLHLVFEASRERRILLGIAPHLVQPLRFTWPVYEGARIPRWKLGAGLLLYDILAMFRNVGRHKRLGARGVLEAEPALASVDLRGGATYWDAHADDSRLTLANVIDAAAHGATVVNHAEVRELSFAPGRGPVDGVVVRDRLGGVEVDVRARLVVNATGPWTDEIARMENPAAGPAVRGTKGVHIAVPADRVGNVGAVTMLSPDDGRVMFTIPAGPHTIIGTTDTPTDEHPSEVRASPAEVRYLLAACNRFFPAARLTEDDVISAWAGIRPLVASLNSGDPSSASREHAIRFSDRGVLAITGGKLTTYREMAEQCVDAATSRLGMNSRRCDTAEALLPGERPASRDDDVTLIEGLQWRESDVVHAVQVEFAETLADVLMRRTLLAFETRDHGVSVAPRVAHIMGALLGWPGGADGATRAVAEYQEVVERVFGLRRED